MYLDSMILVSDSLGPQIRSVKTAESVRYFIRFQSRYKNHYFLHATQKKKYKILEFLLMVYVRHTLLVLIIVARIQI